MHARQHQFGNLIKEAGLTFPATAGLLGVSERTIQRWAAGSIEPKKVAMNVIGQVAKRNRWKSKGEKKYSAFRFIDLFAGIGGMRIPFEEISGECVFSSEWDKFAQKTYAANFGETPAGDITQIELRDIPDHDLLLAGFPCQSFSMAGSKRGFLDTRGTMFFEIQRILVHHKPKVFVLENVKQLRGHSSGQTLKTILNILQGEGETKIPEEAPVSESIRKSLTKKLNYQVDFKILKSSDFGVPQKRERIFIVGFNKDYYSENEINELFSWPEGNGTRTSLKDILLPANEVDGKYTISEHLWAGHIRRKKEHKEKGNGFGYGLFSRNSPYSNTLSARYYKDGSEILIDQSDLGKRPRRLCPRECARLQGFPDGFIINCVSDVQAYKQLGNAVTVPVIRAIAQAVAPLLQFGQAKSKQMRLPLW